MWLCIGMTIRMHVLYWSAWCVLQLSAALTCACTAGWFEGWARRSQMTGKAL
jgi:hypothetical protein